MFKALKGARHDRPFAFWRIVVWLVMLLAAVGFVINTYGSIIAANAIGAMSPEAIAAGGPDPRVLMAWSLGYAIGAFAVMVLALGTLRWREWGRSAMRVVAGLLAIWAIYTAVVAFHQSQEIGVVLSQAGLPPELLVRGMKTRSILLVGVVLKAISVPVLAWLAWVLGSVSVRQQFAQPAL
jgi:glucan phosphoethanolaminetransferase (alkaline phosphatase superfamily)